MPIFMKYEGIKGESKHPRHRGEIGLSSLQWGTASATSVSEIVVTKLTDKASPALMRESLVGKGREVIITFEREKPGHSLEAFMILKLENTLISSYSVASGGERPIESLSLNFTKITFTPPGLQGSFLFWLARIVLEAL